MTSWIESINARYERRKATRRERATYLRRRLDQFILAWREAASVPVPKEGLAHNIRLGLGMTLRHVAERMGVSVQAAWKLEQDEPRGAVTIERMRRFAEALDCRFHYAILPDGTNFEGLLLARVHQRYRDAGKTWGVVEEAFEEGPEHRWQIHADLVRRKRRENGHFRMGMGIMAGLPQDLWDEPGGDLRASAKHWHRSPFGERPLRAREAQGEPIPWIPWTRGEHLERRGLTVGCTLAADPDAKISAQHLAFLRVGMEAERTKAWVTERWPDAVGVPVWTWKRKARWVHAMQDEASTEADGHEGAAEISRGDGR